MPQVQWSLLGLRGFLILGHLLPFRGGSLVRLVDGGVTSDAPEVLVRDGVTGVRVRDVIVVDVLVLEPLPSVKAVAAVDDVSRDEEDSQQPQGQAHYQRGPVGAGADDDACSPTQSKMQ